MGGLGAYYGVWWISWGAFLGIASLMVLAAHQAAQVPSSQVTCSSPRRPWINCRMLPALVSKMVSMTSFPLPFRTAITIASLCTSMPIYLMSRLIAVAYLGERFFVLTLIFPPKVKCHSPADLPMPSCTSLHRTHHCS